VNESSEHGDDLVSSGNGRDGASRPHRMLHPDRGGDSSRGAGQPRFAPPSERERTRGARGVADSLSHRTEGQERGDGPRSQTVWPDLARASGSRAWASRLSVGTTAMHGYPVARASRCPR
jgi:hypothetical protein